VALSISLPIIRELTNNDDNTVDDEVSLTVK